ncbi:MAG TPA: prolyl oligopeptidase family serine peptidase [Thermoanaerobaculia bacterium]|nr:prolyl oligopeptidase family serine peptidase [Thermoanaerobaculia bacterium]
MPSVRALFRYLDFRGLAAALLLLPSFSGLAAQQLPAPPSSAASSAAPARTKGYEYPAAPKGELVEDYHGTKVADPYRSLENPDDPATAAWVEAENALTRSVLERPEREKIKARLTELFDYPKVGIPEKKANRYFFSKNTGLQNQSVYYVQEGLAGEPRALIDPNTMSPDGTVALTNTSPAKNGRLLGYAISRSGSDRQEIFIRDVATGKDLPDKLVWVKFSGISWTPDGKGFFYTRYPQPGTVAAGDEHYFPKYYYHRLGDPQEKDAMFFEKPTEKEVGVGGFVSYDGRWLVILPGKGASNKTEVWVLDLKKAGARPVPVFSGFAHAYQVAEVVDGKLYARTDRDAPLGRLIMVDLERLTADNKDAPFVELIPQGKDTLQTAYIINKKLVLRRLRNASTALEVRTLSGKFEKEIALPVIGSVGGISGEADQKELFLSFSSFTVPPTNYRYDFDKGELVLFRKTDVKVDPSLYETEQVWYPSKDGTKVSMFLVHRKGLKRDGNRPVYLSAYGGFNISQTPGFSATRFAFLERDGILAIPNLRGGGEYGEEWHQAGMREKKQNVFDDFIGAAEWLIGSGYTKPQRLAIQGGSNGGLLVSAVEVQRPDLYGAVICQVPVADMLRYQKFTVGRYWIAEYGSSEAAVDFAFLYKYSPYHNVRDGVSYPATLVTTADTDDRVAPGHGKKLAARLQAAQAGDRLILLRVETKAGHGAGKPTTKILDEQADIYTFLFWQLGMI